MSSLVGPPRGIPAPADLWDGARRGWASTALGALVHRSNLLGADRSVANQGGGNTSAKGVVVDHAPRARVLWVKAPAPIWRRSPAATSPRCGSTRSSRSVAQRQWTMRRWSITSDAARWSPTSRARPSRRSCTRSWTPYHVDHTHPDAVIALTSTPNGRLLADETFGDEAVGLDYQRPGFDMSKRIAALLDTHPSGRAVLLERHGLVTWGSTAEETYRSTIEAIESCRGGGQGRSRPVRPGRRAERGARGERVPRSPRADALRSAARSSPTQVLVLGRPEPVVAFRLVGSEA